MWWYPGPYPLTALLKTVNLELSQKQYAIMLHSELYKKITQTAVHIIHEL